MAFVLLGVFAVVGVVLMVRPQVVWRVNRPLQARYVRDYDATEPTRAVYRMQRVVGAVFFAASVWMMVMQVR